MERNSGGGYEAQKDGEIRQEQTIGGRIRAFRTMHGLTQEQLAERILVTRQAVAKWENDNGVPDVDNLIRLADAFDVWADVLLGRKGSPVGRQDTVDGNGSAQTSPFAQTCQSEQPSADAAVEQERQGGARRERNRRCRPLAARMSAVAAVVWGIAAVLAYQNGLPLLCGLQIVCMVIWTVNAVYHTIKLRQGR